MSKSSTNSRFNALSKKEMLSLFCTVDGYADGQNDTLYCFIEKLKLTVGENNVKAELLHDYAKVMYAISFLEMINAWQWFLTAQHTREFSASTAQRIQNEYYSIFFSMLSYLSLNQKGSFNISINGQDGKSVRKSLWCNFDKGLLEVGEVRLRGGEHESTAMWFYKVFLKSEFNNSDSIFELYKDETGYHSKMRNWFTYRIGDIAEDLFETPTNKGINNVGLFDILNGFGESIDFEPETFTALQYLKFVTDLHLFLIKESGMKTPNSQKLLLHCFKEHCKQNGRYEFIELVFGDVIKNITL